MSDTEGERPAESTPETPVDASAARHAETPARPAAQPAAPRRTAAAPAAQPHPCRRSPSHRSWQPPQGVAPRRCPGRLPALPAAGARRTVRRAPGVRRSARCAVAVRVGIRARRPARTRRSRRCRSSAPRPVRSRPPAPKKKSGAGKVVGLIVAAAIVGGAAGLGGAYAGVNLFTPDGTSPAAGPSTVTVNNTDAVNQTTAIAAKVLPSVVTIQATGTNGARHRLGRRAHRATATS